MYTSPVIIESLDESIILKELSGFFYIVAKPTGGVGPVDVNVAKVVFGQKLGDRIQTGRFNVVVSAMK